MSHEGYKKRIKYDFPNYEGKGFKYEMNSTEACIVIPIFYGFEGTYPAYHVNAACWGFHSYLVNTNVVEKGVPLFFYIERQLWEPAVLQLKKAGIPDNRLIQWSAPPRVKEWKGQYFAQKLFTVLDPFFDTYDMVMMPDGDLYLSTALTERFDISALFGRIDPENYATYGMTEGLERSPRYSLYYDLPNAESFQLWQSLVKEHLGFETEQVHRSDGGLNAWCPRTLKADFKDFVRRYSKYFGSEEDVNSLYVQYTGHRLEDLRKVWDIKMVRTTPDLANYSRENSYFFIHSRPYRMPREDDVEYFRRLIGQHKELL